MDLSPFLALLQSEVANYLKGHFLGDADSDAGAKELRDWDVSRPAPYFGFEIPDEPGHYWYVWFDAPVGYIASTLDWCRQHDQRLEDWWNNEDVEIHHFIGKDITYFHTLFWPGMLKVAGFSLPTKIHIHGFLTVDGAKMAKSTGTQFTAETYLKYLDPEALRYYYAAKLGNRLDDIDLNLAEFVNKVNSDLVGKVVNLASRTAKFIEELGLSAEYPDDGGLFQKAATAGAEIAEAYENAEFSRAMRLIMELADRANPYVESHAPWTLKKDPQRQRELQDVCTVALNLFRQLAIYLAPVLPALAEKVGELLNDPIQSWDQSQQPLLGRPISRFQHLMKRIDPKDVNAMIDESKQQAENENRSAGTPDSPNAAIDAAIDAVTTGAATTESQWNDSDAAIQAEPLADECTIDDFVKVDLRVARIVAAEHVAEARKLLKLTLSLGGENQRQVFAGIKAAYDPEQLVGRLVVVVANLKPRQMKFGLSEGMICAAGGGGSEVFLLSPDSGAVPGQRVH